MADNETTTAANEADYTAQVTVAPPPADDPTVTGAEARVDGAYGLASMRNEASDLSLSLTAYKNRYGFEETKRQLDAWLRANA